MTVVPDDDHVRRLPKVELHTHVEGAASADTVARLARRNGVDLGVDHPDELYRYRDLADFLAVYDLVCRSIVTVADVHEVTYEALAIAARAGVRYREMFFSPTFLLRHGVAFDTIWSGVVAGVEDAAADHGIVCRMILDVDKPSGPGPALELVEKASGCDRSVLIGIGGDAGEVDVDLAALAPPFAEARRRGFRTTMHLGEEGPAADIATGVDDVGAERVDHGFSVLDDPDLTARMVDAQVPFTVCPTSNLQIGLVRSLREHPLVRMRDRGLLVTVNSDNAAMFGIDLADELGNVRDALGCDLDALEDFALAGVDAAWLDEGERAALRRSFTAEMDRLRIERHLDSRFGAAPE